MRGPPQHAPSLLRCHACIQSINQSINPALQCSTMVCAAAPQQSAADGSSPPLDTPCCPVMHAGLLHPHMSCKLGQAAASHAHFQNQCACSSTHCCRQARYQIHRLHSDHCAHVPMPPGQNPLVPFLSCHLNWPDGSHNSCHMRHDCSTL